MFDEIILFGGGGHGKVVLDCLQDNEVRVTAIVDNKYSGDLLGVRRVAEFPRTISPRTAVIVTIGDNGVRKSITQEITQPFANAIHRTALVSKHASLGTGCMVLHRSVIQAGANIGSHVIVNTGAQVDHDCVISDFVHLAPGSVLCGSVTVGEGTLVGAAAVVKPGVKIGAWVTIGSGAVVTKDLPDFAVAVGNPAAIIKYLQR